MTLPLTKSLRAKASALADLEPEVRADAPDAVHQMRVAVRTLRANLRTFQNVLPDADRRTALVDDLSRLGDALGPAREAEVLQEHILDLLDRTPADLIVGPVRQRVEAVFTLERESAFALITDALDSPEYRDLLHNLDAYLASSKPDSDPESALPRLHRKARKRMRKAFPMPSGPERDTAMHEARKAVRRARYAAEALGHPAKRIKALQDVLGDEHDRVVTASALTDLAAGAQQAGENAFTYGVLVGLVRCDSHDFDRRLRKAWRKAKPHLRAGKR